MLPRQEIARRVEALLERVKSSEFKTLDLFAGWLGAEVNVLRQWKSRGASDAILARLLAEASTVPLKEWVSILGVQTRLHDGAGKLKDIHGVGLAEEVGVNPKRVRMWAADRAASAEERLAIVVCLTRELPWLTRYGPQLIKNIKARDRRQLPEEQKERLEKLRRRRIDLNYTRHELGAMLGIPGGTIGMWEMGRSGYDWRYGQPNTTLRLYAKLLEMLPVNLQERKGALEGPRILKLVPGRKLSPEDLEEKAAERKAAELESRGGSS